MVVDEKDRFGNKLRDVERAREDQYFAEQDRKLVEALRAKEERTAGIVHCPKDGTRLEQHSHHGVTVEECPGCHVMWLDYGELQELAGNETDSWIARWLRNEFRKSE